MSNFDTIITIVSDPCCTAGLLFEKHHEKPHRHQSQIPAVRRGFCWPQLRRTGKFMVSDPCCTAGFLLFCNNYENELDVSDPCCTAGFLLFNDDLTHESKVSDPCCTAGFLLFVFKDKKAAFGLRFLLYGGVFVADDPKGWAQKRSQIPAVRRGFCWLPARRVLTVRFQIPAVRRGFCCRMARLRAKVRSQIPAVRRGFC